MARHRCADGVAGQRPSPVRLVGPSSRSPRPHWIRTRFEAGTDVDPRHGLYAYARWTPELIADAPPPWRRLRRRDRRFAPLLKGVMPGGLLRFKLSAPDVDKPAEVG